MIKNKYTFIDLFAGCGGLSEGFLQSGKFEGLAHVEWELPMVRTLRNRLFKKWNHTKEEALKNVVHFDIQRTKELLEGNWSKKSIADFGNTNHHTIIENGLKGIVQNKPVHLIIGGPPCQAYSIAGRAQDKNSMQDDYRNYLFESFIKVVEAFQPEMFVFENVPGMLSATPGGIPVTQRISEAFQKAGYKIQSPNKLKDVVFTASDLGVAQKRNRVILIGVRENTDFALEDIYDAITNEGKKSKSTTVKDAIGNLAVLKPLKEPIQINGKNVSHFSIDHSLKDTHHTPRYHNPRDIQVFKHWIETNMNNKSTEEKIAFYNSRMNKQSNHAKYRNLEWDKPSPTVVAHLYKDGLMFIHPDESQARSITVREAALLQSFPIDYEFLGSQGYAYKMIGNAVPPKMAETIANGISKVLSKELVS